MKENNIHMTDSALCLNVETDNNSVKKERHSEGVQLFLDYLRGDEAIEPSMLMSFKKRVDLGVHKGRYIGIGHIGGKAVYTHLPIHIDSGEEVTFVPNYDSVRKYFWFNIFVSDEKGNVTGKFSKRILKEERRLCEWKGPNVQTIVDWVSGSVPLSLVKPVTLPVERKILFLESSRDRNLCLTLKRAVSKGDKVTLVCQEDELYKWIDVYKEDVPDGGERASIASYRVVKREGVYRLDSKWSGPERQRYIDYLNGEIEFSKLQPLRVMIYENGSIYLFPYARKVIHANIRSFPEFNPGDVLIFSPTLEDEDYLWLKVVQEKNDSNSVVFRLNKKNMSLVRVVEGTPEFRQSGYWSRERIENEAIEIYQREGILSGTLLRKLKRDDLVGAIFQRYPGKMIQLKKNLGISIPAKLTKEPGFWNPAIIEEEAQRIYAEEGEFHYGVLNRLKRKDLSYAIGKYYPGGIFGLREKLGISVAEVDEERSAFRSRMDRYMERLQAGENITYEEFIQLENYKAT